VTATTDITKLNLNWRERDLPERERTKHVHRLHPYLGKFIPQLAEIFLRKYSPKLVVDPFCGSGTTLVEALSLGIDSFGSDISEFNCLLTRMKTSEHDLDLLQREVTEILSNATGEVGLRMVMESRALYSTSSYLQQWYAPEALSQLIAYRELISQYQYQDVLKIILSRAARSARLTTHFDLDFPQKPQLEPYECYKHKRICKPTTSAKQFLKRYSADTIRRITEFSKIRRIAKATVVCGDSREIEFPKADLILTSPPYVGLIDYHAQHRYAFELLNLPSHESEEIGSASRGSSEKAKQSYIRGIKDVFQNLEKHVNKGCLAVVVVHDKGSLYNEIASDLGYTITTELHRQVNRRTGRRAGEFYESIYIWKMR
jgi:hypothetical protein